MPAASANRKKGVNGFVADKREAILRAAIKVFASKGYFNSKVADIAAEAGIADGTVYLYFKSKDEILHSIFDRAMAEFIADGKKELATLTSPTAKLTRIAELHLEKLGADRDLAVVFQVELRGSTKFMREFSAAGFGEYLDIIRQTIEDGQRTGAFRADIKPIVAAKIVYGALDEMVTNWVLSKRSYPLAPMAGEVMKIFFGGILSK
jgi:TetR/AcrR family transcriptional regulator, fatty acid metabolism regulator protein